MRKLLYLIVIVTLFGCDKNNNENPEVNYFDFKNMNQLNLLELENYWTEGLKIDTSYYMGADFENHSGFLNGIRLYAGNGKAIGVSVFQTKDDAINAMESRISDVACLINSGDSTDFESQWWFSDCMDYAIYFNRHNTIVEVDFSSNAPTEIVMSILLGVANEIKDRIDLVSINSKAK